MKTQKLFLTLILGLSACASHDPYNPTSGNNLYFCDNAEQVIISLRDQGDYAALSFRGDHMTLMRISEEHFSNSIYDLHINKDEAVLEREGVPYLTGCRSQR